MATNKLGTLVYDLIADTKGFQKGIVSSQKEVTALKKVFLESRTPVEAFGIQMQGMQKLIESGARPVNMFSRSIADLAVKTKGGGREARAFVESLRQQASQIVQSVGHYRVLSKEDRERVDRLRAVARAIEREVDMQRNAIAEKLRAKRASDQEARSARLLSAELKKLEAERNKQSAAIKRQADAQAALLSKQKQEAQAIRDRLDPRRALARQMTGVRALGAAGMLSPEEVAAEQKRIMQSMRQLNPVYREQQERLARVREGLQNLITPQQRVRQQVRELRQEYRAGNVSYGETVQRMRQLRQEHRSLRTQTNESSSAFRAFTSQMFAQTAALAQQISAITIAYKVLGEGRKGIAGALELGRATKEFEIFTGSAETSLALMSGIRNLAAETPLTMGATTQTVRTLLQYGTANQDVLEITRRLGDVSGGSTERMQRLALAMGQITANGRLQGQELRQLVESGFNPLQVLSQELNVSMMELRIRMADGSISAEDVASALRSATSEGGRFADALERIGNETAFGKVQKLRGEYEKLRDEMYAPGVEVLAEIASATTNAIRSYREFVKMFAKHETEEGFQRKKKAIASRSLLSVLFGQPSQIAGGAMDLIRANMLEVERRAIEMEKAQIEASEKTEIAYDKANESITERIAALRKERNELLMGKESYELMDLRRQGASDEYLDALRKEMQLLDEAKRKQKDAEEAEKKRHEAAMQRQKEKERALEKERADRLKQIEDDRRAAESLAKSIRTPLEVLEDEMTDIQKVAEFLTVNQRVKLMEQARERFNKAMQEDGQLNAAAATRGSVEEFRLLSEINKQQVDREQKNHNEAMDARNKANRLLDLNISGLNILPVKLGAALSELMGTPVRASGVPTFSFLPPSSFDRR